MSHADRWPVEQEIIGALLKGGCMLFGKRVELSWPGGLPGSMTEDDLRRLGEQWAQDPASPIQWVPADARYCRVKVPCGKVLKDGECEWHGAQP